MRSFFFIFSIIICGCTASVAPRAQDFDKVSVVYTDFDIVTSSGSFGLDKLLGMPPVEVEFDAERTKLFMAEIQKYRIGKSSFGERSQLRGPVYLAIFKSGQRVDPVFVSDGCYLLNTKSYDLYLFSWSLAKEMSVTRKQYDSRLCKEPGLGIKLSPQNQKKILLMDEYGKDD